MLLQRIAIILTIIFLIYISVSQVRSPEWSTPVGNQNGEKVNQVDSNEVVMESETNEAPAVEEIKRVSEPCDYDSLTVQLKEILKANGWYEYEVPMLTINHTYISNHPSTGGFLPFDIESVCVVEMMFQKEYSHENLSEAPFYEFTPTYDYSEFDPIKVGDEIFTTMPASGPDGDSDVVPLRYGNAGVQLSYFRGDYGGRRNEYHENMCPCLHTYTAQLTAPMYPPEDE